MGVETAVNVRKATVEATYRGISGVKRVYNLTHRGGSTPSKRTNRWADHPVTERFETLGG